TKHLPNAGRDAPAEFGQGHIAGARFLDLGSLFDAGSDVPEAFPTSAQVAGRLAALGIWPHSRIVLYDDSGIRSACRAWLILHVAGWAEVGVLDARFAAWREVGLPVESGIPAPAPTNASVLEGDRTLIRSKPDMLANLDTRAEQLVDARDAGRFTGETEDTVHGLPGGHIPGARTLFFGDLLHEDGSFRSAGAIADTFERAGIDPARPVVASCGSGVTASVVLFAHRLLGHSHGALYDGSWSEWGADPATPKQTGTAA
ncbi:MAG: sulfurtransferase, partial [Alteraurantiacibacter sp.]